ncbi:MAG: hypothetical protein R3B45_15710 [Bdellovibrionota bacterium]
MNITNKDRFEKLDDFIRQNAPSPPIACSRHEDLIFVAAKQGLKKFLFIRTVLVSTFAVAAVLAFVVWSFPPSSRLEDADSLDEIFSDALYLNGTNDSEISDTYVNWDQLAESVASNNWNRNR